VPLELINIAEKKRFMDGEKVSSLWSDLSHKATARGARSKPLTPSGWAASFVIQLISQLQVRMIRTQGQLRDVCM
jgi:hypothetical protein